MMCGLIGDPSTSTAEFAGRNVVEIFLQGVLSVKKNVAQSIVGGEYQLIPTMQLSHQILTALVVAPPEVSPPLEEQEVVAKEMRGNRLASGQCGRGAEATTVPSSTS